LILATHLIPLPRLYFTFSSIIMFALTLQPVKETVTQFLNVGDLVRTCRVSKEFYEHYRPLVHSQFILPFTSGCVVGHWKFDQAGDQVAQKCVDSSGRGHHGSLWDGLRYCNNGHGVDFHHKWPKVGFVQVSEGAAELDPTEDGGFTVEAWVHPFRIDDREYANPIVSKHDYACGWELRLFRLGVTFMVSRQWGYHQEIFGVRPKSGRYWTHIAGTFGNNTLQVFQDRALCETIAPIAREYAFHRGYQGISVSKGPLVIGKCAGISSEAFRRTSCEIAEVRISKKVLSTDEFLPYPLYQP